MSASPLYCLHEVAVRITTFYWRNRRSFSPPSKEMLVFFHSSAVEGFKLGTAAREWNEKAGKGKIVQTRSKEEMTQIVSECTKNTL